MTQTKQVVSPFDHKVLAALPMVDADQIEQALVTAHRLFLDQDQWLPGHQRIAILEKLVAMMSESIEELTKLAASEGGKPYIDSKVEVHRAINGVKLAIEHISQLKGEQIPMGHTASSVERIAFTMREPIGVVVAVSAFNHPLNLIVHQVISAVAAGCPVIVKPASATPMSCFRLVEMLEQAGLPKGWCQPVICSNQDAETLVTDERVNYLTFIGSAKVGWYLQSKLSPGTRSALEHGGAAPVIVEPDADFDDMIASLLKGGFYHAGQVCVSVQRVYAEQSIAEQLAQNLAIKAAQLVVGDPLNPDTEVGPLINPKEVDRVEQWVEEARAAGGKILCGGKRLSDTCYAPTVILDPPDDAQVSTHEIFGPVVCVYSYADRNDAIARANGLPLAFQGAVFTKDLDVALDTVKRLNATAVMVNDHTAFRVDWMPFGGRDASGLGMGGIPYTMHEMTRDKMMVIKSPVL